MKSYENTNKELLISLIEQLTELNDKIGRTEPGEKFVKGQWSYLFGFNPEGSSNKKDYLRYNIFMKSVTAVLGEFGIHRSNNGYTYIIDAVMIILDLSSLDIRLRNDVYPFIAMKYDIKNYSVIDHSIRNAITSACKDNEKPDMCNGMVMFSKKPTSKQFIFLVTERVCQHMCDTAELR